MRKKWITPEQNFPVRYWCKACGAHFDGCLSVQVFQPEHEPIHLCFFHDRCISCGSERTVPHVDPKDRVPYSDEPSLQHYVSALKLSLGVEYIPVYEYLPAQPKDEPYF